jgi:hypothetical protein
MWMSTSRPQCYIKVSKQRTQFPEATDDPLLEAAVLAAASSTLIRSRFADLEMISPVQAAFAEQVFYDAW